MVDTSINFPGTAVDSVYSVSLSAGSFPVEAVQLARDLVAGYSGDYLFFQYDEDEFTLILSDSIQTVDVLGNVGYHCDAFEAYSIHVTEHVQTAYRSNTGSLSGSIVGVEGGVAVEEFSGSFSGSYEVQEVSPSTYALYHDSFEHELDVSNSAHAVIYSSFDGTPSLVDGAQKYGFMVSALMCGCIVFYFINSLLKRVR